MYQSTKIKDGYSTTFRQWRAEKTHCRFLHGYGTSVKFTFQGQLDPRNWVFDFGGFKRAKCLIDGVSPDEWLSWLLDHTTIIAEDDPALEQFLDLDSMGIIQLRIVEDTGAERFAEFIGNHIAAWVDAETGGRVRLVSCEFREHEKNSATYFL